MPTLGSLLKIEEKPSERLHKLALRTLTLCLNPITHRLHCCAFNICYRLMNALAYSLPAAAQVGQHIIKPVTWQLVG